MGEAGHPRAMGERGRRWVYQHHGATTLAGRFLQALTQAQRWQRLHERVTVHIQPSSTSVDQPALFGPLCADATIAAFRGRSRSMDNIKTYGRLCRESRISSHRFSKLAHRSIDEWDSVAHMQLVGEIEDAFDIMLETQDVLDMSSFGKATEIFGKYGIDFSS